MSDTLKPQIPSPDGQPAWEAAYFFPPQGRWSEETFLQFHTNRMAELVEGRLEILPMPSPLHQLIVIYFLDAMRAHLRANKIGGTVLVAPLPSPLFPGTIREPDVLYIAPENTPVDLNQYPENLDFVVEVVSSGTEARKRDYEDKPIDYAKAGIAEYWIVDPEDWRITVLGLEGDAYQTLGEYAAGETAQSQYFKGFEISVDDVKALAAKKH